jgi:8-oxo-dGTP diphosphatase
MAEQEKRAQVGVSVIIKNGDRILLEKRQHSHGAGTWGPPSGHIDYGEVPEQTAIRETMEETGVTISDVKFRVVTNDVFEAEQKHYITLWFEAKYVSGEPKVKAPEEESNVGWFTWDSLPQPLFLPLQHLLEGKTYPSQTTEDKIGAAIESSGVLPKAEIFENATERVQIVSGPGEETV